MEGAVIACVASYALAFAFLVITCPMARTIALLCSFIAEARTFPLSTIRREKEFGEW